MANLRGGTFDKQVRDAWHRLERFGTGRHGRDDHATHSLAVGEKRGMYLRDFARYAQERGMDEKLNQLMGDRQIVSEFMQQRLEGLSHKSAVDYVSGWSSMVQGLREANVTIDRGADRAIEAARDAAKSIERTETRTERAIERVDQVVGKMYELRYESGVLAQIQRETGFRTSEAYKLARDPEKYIKGGQVVGMVGKNNNVYDPKPITPDLAEKLRSVGTLPKQETYVSHFREAVENDKAVPHDFRYTYAKEAMEHRLANGMDYRQALREVSRELNHHREDVTERYLKGA